MANIVLNAHSKNARPLKPFGSKVKRNEKKLKNNLFARNKIFIFVKHVFL